MPTLTIDEWAFHERATRKPKFGTPDEFNRNATIAVAKRAETVVNHEGYQTFLDHLGALRDKAQADGDELRRRLAESEASTDLVLEWRRQAAQSRGAVTAFEIAMALIPSLVEQGRAAQSTPEAERVAFLPGAQ